MDRDEAADLLARLHEAQNRLYGGGDDEPVRRLLADTVVWHVPGDNPIAGTYRGPAEVLGYMRRRREIAGATMRMRGLELLVGDGEHVASRTDGTAHIDGVDEHWSTVGLYRVREGRIAECWLLPLDPAAFDRVWSGRSRGATGPRSPGA